MRTILTLCTTFFLLVLAPSFTSGLAAQQRDTLVVQAFTFSDDPTLHAWGNIFEYDGMVAFPEPGGRYEKIVMLYTLKCDARTKADGFACGEWDYSTWTRVWEDSTTHWEIGRFITPYGKGLDLGPDGFTWEFDVTDYGPILTDVRRVTAGNSQELLDLKFLFISGVPARDPLSVTQLWTPGSKDYAKVVEDSILDEISVTLDPAGSMYRINTRPQGGNFNGGPNTDNCSEFCDREHSIAVNGDTKFRWNVWDECGDNPVFPQGGTWVYDRAGWCPGAIVTTQHHELTPHVTPGETITLDYAIENPPGRVPYGHWVFWADLVAYGEPNFALDAGIERIIAPSTVGVHQRRNPWCGGPVIEVVNRGTTDITSIEFAWSYGAEEGMEYVWEGTIPFLGHATIELPAIPAAEWIGELGDLNVEIRGVNGSADEYRPNDVATSRVVMPDRLPSTFTINLLTNRLASVSTENYDLRLYDTEGNLVLQKNDFGVEEQTKIPLDLDEGCYRLELHNPEGFGLDFWAHRDVLGTGSLRLETGEGDVIREFGTDFGNSLIYSFRVPAPTAELDQSSVDFGRGKVDEPILKTLRITPENSLGVTVTRAIMLTGRNVFFVESTDPPISDPVVLQHGDTLRVNLRFQPKAEVEYAGRLLLNSNDARGTIEVDMQGVGDNSISSVEGDEDRRPDRLRVWVTDGSLRWSVDSDISTASSAGTISIYDATGSRVFSRPLGSGEWFEGVADLDRFSSGHYTVRIESNNRTVEAGFTYVR